jgi:hypothetical protein
VSEYRVRLLAVIFSLLYFLYVVRKLRKQQLSVSRSLLWLLSGGVMLGLSIFPQPLAIAAHWAGFEVPTNAVFVLWLLVLTMVLFSQTLAISRYDDQLRRLAQDYALLQAKAADQDSHSPSQRSTRDAPGEAPHS